jgi:hypothetical protein
MIAIDLAFWLAADRAERMRVRVFVVAAVAAVVLYLILGVSLELSTRPAPSDRPRRARHGGLSSEGTARQFAVGPRWGQRTPETHRDQQAATWPKRLRSHETSRWISANLALARTSNLRAEVRLLPGPLVATRPPDRSSCSERSLIVSA